MSRIKGALRGIDYIKSLELYEKDIKLQEACYLILRALEEFSLLDLNEPLTVSTVWVGKYSSANEVYFICPSCGETNLLGCSSNTTCGFCGKNLEVIPDWKV